MPAGNGSRTHATEKQGATSRTPRVPTPASARWVVTLGGGAALLAAAAISFEGLSGLGQMIGIRDPWLMPASIDIYASTSALAALLLPEGHDARGAAVWNARLGLAMSMVGNAAFRAFHLGGFTLQDWVLTFIGTWPPAIVERLLHLQGNVNGAGEVAADAAPSAPADGTPRADDAPPPGAGEPADENADKAPIVPPTAPERPPTMPPIPAADSRARSNVVNLADRRNGADRRSLDDWVVAAEPHYRALADRLGRKPTAPELVAELVAHGQPELKSSRARDVRRETEKLVDAAPEADSDSDRDGQEVA